MTNLTAMILSIAIAWITGFGFGQVFHYLRVFVKKCT